MTSFAFTQVDVFGNTPLKGNPLAIVHDADGLTTEQMQQFAKWTNLSETTFLLTPTSPEADYRVRIFTPSEEFPFAGHPTLGSAHAWLAAGGTPHTAGRVVQECGVGNVALSLPSLSDDSLAFAAPDLLRSGPVEESTVQTLAASLGVQRDQIIDSQWIDNGPGWVGVLLPSATAVLELNPDFAAMGSLCVAVLGCYSEGSAEKANGIDVEVRAFVPEVGILEDPVTGSANAGLAQWLIAAGHLPAHYVARQGTAIGYDGKILLSFDGATTWVGGAVQTIITGTVEL